MRHTLRTIIWVIAMTLSVCALAQTDTKRAFRMYMHDGSVQFFFYSDIQSMTVGYEDGDMERPVQIINTPDSVYTFAMADIDSVSFARPVTEYKSNVVRLEDGLRSYLTASDSLKLTFRSDVPRNLFPTVGGYLVTLKCDELLPCGFIGKLAFVHEEGGGVVALCDKAAATDVFEKLFIAVGENTTETSNKANTMRAPEDPRVWNGDIDIPPVGFDVNFDIGVGTGLFSGGYSQTGGFEINTQKFHARTFFMVENGELDFSMLCQGEHTLNLDASVGFSASFSKDFPLIKIPIRVPYAFFPVGSWDFGIYFNAEAGLGVNHHFEVPFSSVTHFAFGTRWYPVIGFVPVINNMPNRCYITMGVPEIDLDLEGSASAELGVYGSANIYPAVEEISKLSAGLRTGLKISSQVSWLPTVGPIDKVNTEMYDELNRDDFFRLDWLNTGFVSLESELFNVNLNEKIQWNATRNNPIWKRGVVPEFFDVSLSKNDVAGSLTASAALRRKLAFNANVGLGLYDSNDKLVDSWWCDVKYKDQENTQIAHDFSNLKAGEKYTLHPLVHALNDNMVANPSATSKETDNKFLIEVQSPSNFTRRFVGNVTSLTKDFFWRILLERPEDFITPMDGPIYDGSCPLDVTCIKVNLPKGFTDYESGNIIENVRCLFREEDKELNTISNFRWIEHYMDNEPYEIITNIEKLNPNKEYTIWMEIENTCGDMLKDSISFVSYPKICEDDYIDMGTGVLWASKNYGAESFDQLGTVGEIDEDLNEGRLPTELDFYNLVMSCDIYCGSFNNVNGYMFVASNGNALFFPINPDKNKYYWNRYNIKKEERIFIDGEDSKFIVESGYVELNSNYIRCPDGSGGYYNRFVK